MSNEKKRQFVDEYNAAETLYQNDLSIVSKEIFVQKMFRNRVDTNTLKKSV